MTRILAAALAGLCLLAGAPRADALTLRAEIVARGDVVRAGDFFDGLAETADAPLFRAPRPGASGMVSARRLVAALSRLGHNWTPPAGVERITVRRPAPRQAASAQVVAASEIAALVRAALVRALPNVETVDDISVTLAAGTPAMALPQAGGGSPRAEIAGLVLKPALQRFSATVSAGNGAEATSAEVSGSYELDLPVPVLARDIARGDVVTSGDLATRRLGAGSARRQLESEDDIVGLAARRNLRAGAALSASDLEAPRIVARSQLVTIVYSSPGLTLTTQGRAMGEAALGEAVPVINVSSGRVVQTLVRGPGRVEVTGPAHLAQR
jgi:flagella basal body P-ring formation protein FlgA